MFIYGRQGPPKIWGKGERATLGPATALGECCDNYVDTDSLRGLGAEASAPSTGTSLLTVGLALGGIYFLATQMLHETRPLRPSRRARG